MADINQARSTAGNQARNGAFAPTFEPRTPDPIKKAGQAEFDRIVRQQADSKRK